MQKINKRNKYKKREKNCPLKKKKKEKEKKQGKKGKRKPLTNRRLPHLNRTSRYLSLSHHIAKILQQAWMVVLLGTHPWLAIKESLDIALPTDNLMK